MPAHRPSFASGYSITPGATTGEPMISPWRSAGAMWVTFATAAITACWNAGCGCALSTGGERDGYAFHGGMEAGAHVKQFLRMSGAVVQVIFHPPIAIQPDVDRKTLAAQVHGIVASGLACSDTRPGSPDDIHAQAG